MSNGGAGKGDDLREGFDFRKYWTNFPTLTGNHTPKALKVKKKKGKTTYIYN